MIDGREVASGIIQKVDPDDTVHKIPLGNSRVGVMILQTTEGSRNLPLPTPMGTTLDDAIDCCVSWERSSVFMKGFTIPNMTENQQPSFNDNIDLSKLMEGDEVEMLILGHHVCDGVVFKTLPTDHCHNVILGEGGISVQISEIYDGSFDLPYIHGEARRVVDARDTWVIWDLVNVRRKGQTLDENDPTLEDANKIGKDFALRSDWMGEDVELFSKDRFNLLGRGVISLPYEAGAIDGEPLGPDGVGVAVSEIVVDSFFPSQQKGVPGLVRWAIQSVKLQVNGRFLGDIVDENSDKWADAGLYDIDPPEVLYLPSTKRPYHCIKRMKVGPEERQRRHLQSRAATKTTEESIDAIKREQCCKLKCTLNMSRGEMEEIRSEYHGMSCNNKTSYILNLFHCREESVVKRGLFVLKGAIIC